MIHPILKMGDLRLLRVAKPVEQFDSADLRALIADMFETMHHDAGGVGWLRRKSASTCSW